MPEESEQSQLITPEDGSDNLPGFVEDVMSTIKLTLKVTRNLTKAFERLCSSATDVSVAYFARKASKIEADSLEDVAESNVRINITEAIGAQTIQQMKVSPEFVRRATDKHSEKILREQKILDSTFIVAMKELQRSGPTSNVNQNADSGKQDTISDDFLNEFDEVARNKSSEEMQILFGRILAGEIRNPGAFSIRTLKLLSEIDQKIAVLFERFCSLALLLELSDGSIGDVRVCPLGEAAAQNALKKYGLTYFQLNLLNEYGLIISDYSSSVPFINNGIRHPFQHQGKSWFLESLATKKHSEFRVYGVSLTHAGRELFPIVDQENVVDYTQDLKNFFASQNLQMVEFPRQAKS